MKGFKTVKEFTFPREKGFTGSAGLTSVKSYLRGGKVSEGNAGTRREDPVTEVDRSPLGGRTELRPGYAKGGRNFMAPIKKGKIARRAQPGKIKRAEGGKVKKAKEADDDRSFLEKLISSGAAGKASEKLSGRRRQIDDAVDAAERGYAQGGYAKGGNTARSIAKPAGHGSKRRYGGFARSPLIGK